MKEIVSSIYRKYPADKKTRPCLHPIVQLIGGEWREADALKRDVSWATINLPNVIQLCRHQAQQNPGWNADLSAERLEKYLGDILYLPTSCGITANLRRALWEMMVRFMS